MRIITVRRYFYIPLKVSFGYYQTMSDKEIAGLLNDLPYLTVEFTINSAPDLCGYQVFGLGMEDDASWDVEAYEYAWKCTGGVEGSDWFTFDEIDTVTAPSTWEKCKIDFRVNQAGGHQRAFLEPKGFLGYGSCDDGWLHLGLHVKPEIAKDLCDKLSVFMKPRENQPRSVRCDLVNLRRDQTPYGGGIHFDIAYLSIVTP